MTKVTFLYTTFPDEMTAANAGTAIVEARFAACVNILPGMKSIYRWSGRTETASEAVMIVKTTCDAAEAAKQKILDLHPYETPCVIALSVDPDGSNEDFVNWVRSQTGKHAG